MADNILIDNGSEAAFTASTDLATSGHVQRVKLTYSGDGLDTHVSADASGLLVNLGANNDVTLTSGTLTAIAGTVVTSFAGTPTVNIAGGTTTFSGALSAGSALVGYVGLSADGTAIADILSLTNGTAVAVGLYDSEGDQVTLAAPLSISATPTLTTVTYAAGEVMGTVMSFTDAAALSGGTGHLTRVTIVDNDDLNHVASSTGTYAVHFFTTTVTVTNDAALAVASDAEAQTYVGSAYTDDGTWVDLGTAKVCTIRMGAPLAYKCAATTLFGVLHCITTDSGASTSGGRVVTIQVTRD